MILYLVIAALTGPQHADVLLAVAARSGRDARAAWTRAQASPDLDSLRAAFRAGVVAVRCMRRAAADGHNAALARDLEAKADQVWSAIEVIKPRYTAAFFASLN